MILVEFTGCTNPSAGTNLHCTFPILIGNNIQFSQALRIPVDHEMPISRQQDTPEVILQRFKNISQEDGNEARYYLEENGGDLARALAAWKEDKDWNDTHFYPNANECSSDLPLDESNHPDASKLSRRGCFRNFMRSQANHVELVPSAASTESWTIVNDTRPQPLTATTGVEEDSVLLSNIISYDENSDIYVVPATGSWKQLRRESSGSGKITDSILSIFGRKRSTSGNSGLGLDDGKVDSMRQPLIDESSYPTPPSYIRRQIS